MQNRSLIIHKYQYGNPLIINKWGIAEPCCDLEEIDIAIIDMAIIPALMADKNGNRLGYGAGFYDRFIPGLRKDCLTITPVADELFVDSLPYDHWDIPVDYVITSSFLSRL
jgi:5-formyltetrahydrofolate cyclo-ligase